MDKIEEKEIKDTENIIKLQDKRTDISKHKFIDEIKGELGSEIKRDLGIVEEAKGIRGFFRRLSKLF
jgi:hypothetical protein